jgi:hypothetical protein
VGLDQEETQRERWIILYIYSIVIDKHAGASWRSEAAELQVTSRHWRHSASLVSTSFVADTLHASTQQRASGYQRRLSLSAPVVPPVYAPDAWKSCCVLGHGGRARERDETERTTERTVYCGRHCACVAGRWSTWRTVRLQCAVVGALDMIGYGRGTRARQCHGRRRRLHTVARFRSPSTIASLGLARETTPCGRSRTPPAH